MSQVDMWEIEQSYFDKGVGVICGVDEAGFKAVYSFYTVSNAAVFRNLDDLTHTLDTLIPVGLLGVLHIIGSSPACVADTG